MLSAIQRRMEVELKNKQNGRNYHVVTEDGDGVFIIFASEIDGMDRFQMSYGTLADFLDEWEDAN